MVRTILFVCLLIGISSCSHKGGNGGWVVGNGLAPKGMENPTANTLQEDSCGCSEHQDTQQASKGCGCK